MDNQALLFSMKQWLEIQYIQNKTICNTLAAEAAFEVELYRM